MYFGVHKTENHFRSLEFIPSLCNRHICCEDKAEYSFFQAGCEVSSHVVVCTDTTQP